MILFYQETKISNNSIIPTITIISIIVLDNFYFMYKTIKTNNLKIFLTLKS